jgi:hypothetical protein
MPAETDRKTHMIRITDPNNSSSYVDVKIIDEISFIDQHDNAQETTYTVDNHNDNTNRQVHVVTVTGSDGVSTADVERVDVWSVLDPHDQTNAAQESQFALIGNMQEPPVHLVTHDFTIVNPDNSNIWIKVQRIDQLSVVDQHDPDNAAQETIYTLNWPDDDSTNPSVVDTSDDGTSINPPWRLDPFQNIIDLQWGGVCIVVTEASQIFWSADGTTWAEVDTLAKLPNGFPANVSPPNSDVFYATDCATYDVQSKTFFVIQSSGRVSNMWESNDGKTWAVSDGWNSWPYFVENGPINSYEETGLIDASLGVGGPWSINGGQTWNRSGHIPVGQEKGVIYPAPVVILKSDMDSPGGGTTYVVDTTNDNLIDASGHVIPISRGQRFAAGNGTLVGFDSNNQGAPVLVVSTDNVKWQVIPKVGDIPGETPGTPDAFQNFANAQLIFAFGKFVFAGNTAVNLGGQWFANPTEIYTSPDGLKWTKVFQAGYTNHTSAPQFVTTPAMTIYYYIAIGMGVAPGTLIAFTQLVGAGGQPVAVPSGWSFNLVPSPPTLTLSPPIYNPPAAATYQLLYNPLIYDYTSPVDVPEVSEWQGFDMRACGIAVVTSGPPFPIPPSPG